ncbi:MAG: hypothetical protein K2K47_10840 [Duncaniella sp.]|nr:hypothetical protein [Duncaniella sp.]
MREALTAILMLVATSTAMAADPLPSAADDAAARLAALPLHPIEGLWSIPGHDTVIEIVRDSLATNGEPARYRMAVVTADDLAVPAGTIVGTATPTAAYGVYDSTIFTDALPGKHLTPAEPRRVTLSLADDDSRLMAKSYGRNVVLRWWRLLPYTLRWALSVTEEMAPDTEGLVRIYPESSLPQNPVYL